MCFCLYGLISEGRYCRDAYSVKLDAHFSTNNSFETCISVFKAHQLGRFSLYIWLLNTEDNNSVWKNSQNSLYFEIFNICDTCARIINIHQH